MKLKISRLPSYHASTSRWKQIFILCFLKMEFNFSVLGGVDGTSVEQVQHSQDNHNSEKKREIEHKAQKNIFFLET